jgi:hypothetical protein
MDRVCGGRSGGSADEEPEEGKLGISPNFELAVKEIVRDWARSDDMAELEHQLFRVFGNFRTIKMLVAHTLCSFREVLQHGGWLPLVKAAAVELGVDEGTVRRWVAKYQRPIEMPGVVIDAAEQRIDPEAKSKSLELFRGTTQGLLANMTREEAYARAVEQEPLHQPPPPAVHPLTAMEKWVADYRDSIRRGLEKVPENHRSEVSLRGTGEEWWLMGHRDPILIEPIQPAVDLSGRRRQTESEHGTAAATDVSA